MGEVEKEKARREAVEHVAGVPPTEGENRVQAAMRRYLGAQAFHDTHEPAKGGERPAKGEDSEEGGGR
ncbi:MAG TPA: hypothetical protein VH915_14050 [Pedococcus sp.]|jgi:hypothetical protein